MEYFIYKDNRQQGPFTIERLAAMGLTSDTLVWREGMGQWTPAWQIDELKAVIEGRASGTAAPPPPPVGNDTDGSLNDGAPADGMQAAAPEHDSRRRRRAVKWLAAAAVVFFILLMSCPKADDHYEAVTREVTEALTDSASSLSTGIEMFDVIGGALGREIVTQFVGAMATQAVKVDNYIILSVGRVEHDGRSHVVSLGILGHVFTFSSAELRKAVRDSSPLPDTMAL